MSEKSVSVSPAARISAEDPARRISPDLSPLPAVWPGQTRRHIVLWDEFPEEVAGLRDARRMHPEAIANPAD